MTFGESGICWPSLSSFFTPAPGTGQRWHIPRNDERAGDYSPARSQPHKLSSVGLCYFLSFDANGGAIGRLFQQLPEFRRVEMFQDLQRPQGLQALGTHVRQLFERDLSRLDRRLLFIAGCDLPVILLNPRAI